MTEPSDIQQAIAFALTNSPVMTFAALNANTCYPVIAPAYVEGQQPLVIQVAAGASLADGPGEGAQEGGALSRRQQFDVAVWYRLKLDRFKHSQQILIESSTNLNAIIAAIRALLRYTFLRINGVQGTLLLTEPLWYVQETAPEWYDEENGVALKTISYGAAWWEPMPRALTWS
jgi:hypothetical protein